MKRILFVCLGNICRSPIAEFVLKDMAKDCDDLYIASAATSNYEIGNEVYPDAARLLAKKGISTVGKRAVQMTRADYDKYDYIIGMDSQNIRDILRITGGDPDKKVKKLLDFTPNGGDIDDPWFTRDFETAYRDISEGCLGFMRELNKEKQTHS